MLRKSQNLIKKSPRPLAPQLPKQSSAVQSCLFVRVAHAGRTILRRSGLAGMELLLHRFECKISACAAPAAHCVGRFSLNGNQTWGYMVL